MPDSMTFDFDRLPDSRAGFVVSMTIDGAPLGKSCPCPTCAEIERVGVAHYTVDRRGRISDITRRGRAAPTR